MDEDRILSDLEASISTDLEPLRAKWDPALASLSDVWDTAEDFLPAIPIFKSLYSIAKGARGLSDRLLMRKIARFLHALDDITQDEREAFVERLEGRKRARIIRDLLLVLEKHETEEKSAIEGELFRAMILGELTTREYLDLRHATVMINVESLGDLAQIYSGAFEEDVSNVQLIYSFAVLQLLGLDNTELGGYGAGPVKTVRLPLGESYVKIVDRARATSDFL